MNPNLGDHKNMCWPYDCWGIVFHCRFLNQLDGTSKLKGYHSLIPLPHSTIHHYPGPNLPFHISSYLLYNCLLKVLVNKCHFPPSLKSPVVYSVKGAGLKWWKVCFTQETKSPFQTLWLRMRTFQWCFHWLQGTKVSSTPMELEKPDGSSAQALYSSFCDRKWLGVLLLSLDGMIVHCRWPPAIVRLPSQTGQYHLHSWVERDIGRVRYLAREHDTVTLAWAPLRTYWSGVQLTNHWAINSQPLPSPRPPLPSPNIDKKSL